MTPNENHAHIALLGTVLIQNEMNGLKGGNSP